PLPPLSFSLTSPAPRSTLFPYTTLFRSDAGPSTSRARRSSSSSGRAAVRGGQVEADPTAAPGQRRREWNNRSALLSSGQAERRSRGDPLRRWQDGSTRETRCDGARGSTGEEARDDDSGERGARRR